MLRAAATCLFPALPVAQITRFGAARVARPTIREVD